MDRRAKFQNRLLTYRKKRGYSQKDLAYFLGHSDQSQVCKWERGIKKPSLENAIELSAALCTPIAFLFPDSFHSSQENIRDRKEKWHKNSTCYEKQLAPNQ